MIKRNRPIGRAALSGQVGLRKPDLGPDLATSKEQPGPPVATPRDHRFQPDIRSQKTRYRLDVAENAEPKKARAVSGLPDSGEEAIRNLVALPLRMLAGTLGIFEAVLHAAADTLRGIDPLDERIVELEKRVDSLEEQSTPRRESARTTRATTSRA